MLSDLLFTAWSGYSGGSIGNLLAQWEQAGVFSYVLPFLLIFALVAGILGQMKLFKNNRAVGSIIALAVALMALQFDTVPRFFSEIFPNFGIGIAIMLVLLILIGLFMDPDKPGLQYALLGVGAIIVIVILLNTSGKLGWSFGEAVTNSWGNLIGIIVVLVLVIMVIAAMGKKNKGGGGSSYKSPLARALSEAD